MKINWNETVGYAAILLAACFFGGSASLGKTIMQSGVSTIMLMEIRSMFSVIVLFPLLVLFGRKHLQIGKADIIPFLLLGIPGLAVVNASYYNAVRLLNVATAVFIQFTAPVVVFLFGLLTGKERSSASKLLALVLSLIGTYLMVEIHQGRFQELPWIGVASAFVSMMSFAFYVILSHRMGKKHSPWTMIFFGYLVAALFWCAVQNPAETARALAINGQWMNALMFTLVSTLIPFVLFLGGLRRVTPTGGAIASTTETVSASLLAYITLGETMSSGQVVGAAMILAAVLLLIISDSASQRLSG